MALARNTYADFLTPRRKISIIRVELEKIEDLLDDVSNDLFDEEWED